LPHIDENRIAAERLRRLGVGLAADLLLITSQARVVVGGPLEVELTGRLVACQRHVAAALSELDRLASGLEGPTSSQ